jgi:hypothetical protein
MIQARFYKNTSRPLFNEVMLVGGVHRVCVLGGGFSILYMPDWACIREYNPIITPGFGFIPGTAGRPNQTTLPTAQRTSLGKASCTVTNEVVALQH